MIADAPSKEAVRQAAAKVFGGSDFVRRKSLWQRFLEWLAKHLGQPRVNVGRGPSTGGFSAVGQFLLWLLVVVVVMGLIAVLVVVARRWTRRDRTPKDDTDIEVIDERTTAEWRADADRLEDAGEWKEALRARYRELIGELIDRRVLSPQAGRTTGEFRLDVAEAAPPAAASFDAASLLFELAWYGHAETGAGENAQFKARATEVLARAEVLDRATVVDRAEVMVES